MIIREPENGDVFFIKPWNSETLNNPNSKVLGANMSAPDGPHVGPMNLAIKDFLFAETYPNTHIHSYLQCLLYSLRPYYLNTPSCFTRLLLRYIAQKLLQVKIRVATHGGFQADSLATPGPWPGGGGGLIWRLLAWSIKASQYHVCWCPGDARSQGIRRHDIVIFLCLDKS